MKKIMFRSKVFSVERENFRINKKNVIFDRIISADVAIILPILDDGRIILERHYRHSIKKYLYEVPAGHIEHGESPERTASRELEEEIGYRAKKLKFIFKAHPTPGNKTEIAYYFVATDLVKSKTNRDADEMITLHKFTLKKALEMIRKNRIKDLKTIAVLLFYVYILNRKP